MYSEQERLIFGPLPHGDGTEVFIDPLAAYRSLVLDLQGEHNQLLEATGSDDELRKLAAEERLLPAARKALSLLPFDPVSGDGCTDKQTLDALRQFCDWLFQQRQAGVI